MSAPVPKMQKIQPPIVFPDATPPGIASKGQSQA